MKELGLALTPELIEREKWNAFWDAPLMVPGRAGTNLDLPRKPEASEVFDRSFLPPKAERMPITLTN